MYYIGDYTPVEPFDGNVTRCNIFCGRLDVNGECDVGRSTIIFDIACRCMDGFAALCAGGGDNCVANPIDIGNDLLDYGADIEGEICDLDECQDENLNTCDDEVGICTNTIGGFECSCPTSGYLDVNGNGEECQDIDECSDDPNLCDSNAFCTNIPGSFICECNDGFQGDGINNCTDIDECSSSNSNNCDTLAPGSTCMNTDGSYICDCPAINTRCDDGEEYKCGWTFSWNGWRRRRGFSYGFGWRKRFFCGCVDSSITVPIAISYDSFTIFAILFIISLLANCCCLLNRCRYCIKKCINKDYDKIKFVGFENESEAEVINVNNYL